MSGFQSETISIACGALPDRDAWISLRMTSVVCNAVPDREDGFSFGIMSVACGVVPDRGDAWISLRNNFSGIQCKSPHTRCLSFSWKQFLWLVVHFLTEKIHEI
jgi:hypothetical protein